MGHTTATCPYRVAPGHGTTPDARAASTRVLAALAARERGGAPSARAPPPPPSSTSLTIDAAVLRLHTRRVTAIEFPGASDRTAVSGDKRGGVAVWDFEAVAERATFRPHAANVNTLRAYGPGSLIASTGSDGALKLIDVSERAVVSTPLHLNPGGWIDGVSDEKTWGQLAGLDVAAERGLMVGQKRVKGQWPRARAALADLPPLSLPLPQVAGDTSGRIWLCDARSPTPAGAAQLHKKGKVHSASLSTADPNLLLTGGGDWTARFHDIRALSLSSDGRSHKPGGPALITCLAGHEKGAVVASYFSPATGRRVLTTTTDNRLRVWDDAVCAASGKAPARTIVHSHDFNRYLTPFRAEWDPSDPSERRITIGRYISESVCGAALHPLDVLDAATGRSLAVGLDPGLSTIVTVARFHPRVPDLIVAGSSRSLYAWRFGDRGAGGGGGDGPGGGPAGGPGAGPGGGDDGGDQPPRRPWRSFDAAEPDDEADAKKKKRKAAAAGAD